MPRHRSKHVPRHSAQRSADSSYRRGALNAVLASAAAPGPGDPDGDETTPLPVLLPLAVPQPRPADLVPGVRPHSHGKRRPVAESAAGLTVSQSVARGVLVTPWFAAATGFVIAVSMWILWPHADLHILAGPAINKEPYGPGGDSSGGVAGSNGGQDSPKPPPSHVTASTGGRRANGTSSDDSAKAAGRAVRYHIVGSDNDYFDIVITLPGKHAAKDWQLSFELRGDENIRVFGASWQPSGQDGGLASALNPGDQHWSGDQSPGFPGPDPDSHDISFQVYGVGSNLRPTGCVLNGKACHFIEVRG
jgi:hypothetical protein